MPDASVIVRKEPGITLTIPGAPAVQAKAAAAPRIVVTVPERPAVVARAIALPRVVITGTAGGAAEIPAAIVPAAEPLSGGDFVAFTAVGAVRARADDPERVAAGFVRQAFAAGATALVYASGRNGGLSGLVPSAAYYLSADNPGKPALVPAGAFAQRVGVAADTTSLVVTLDPPILTP